MAQWLKMRTQNEKPRGVQFESANSHFFIFCPIASAITICCTLDKAIAIVFIHDPRSREKKKEQSHSTIKAKPVLC